MCLKSLFLFVHTMQSGIVTLWRGWEGTVTDVAALFWHLFGMSGFILCTLHLVLLWAFNNTFILNTDEII